MTPFEPARAPHGVTGLFILAPDTDLTLYTPAWNGPTYFLPVGSPQPGMRDTNEDNWYHRLPDLVRCAGTRMLVSFLNTPSDLHTDELEPTPYDLLRQTAWMMSHHTHPQWQALCRAVFTKFKACITVEGVNAHRADYDAINVVYKSLQQDREKADISDIIRQLHQVVDDAIETQPDRVGEVYRHVYRAYPTLPSPYYATAQVA